MEELADNRLIPFCYYTFERKQPATCLLRIPQSALVNINTLRALYPQSRSSGLTGIQTVCLHIALHLECLSQTFNTERFLPFIRTLPSQYTTPLWFQHAFDEETAKTVGTLLQAAPETLQECCRDVEGRFSKDWQATLLFWVGSGKYSV